MRCDNVRIRFEIPLPINKPDSNGNIYTKEAILNSVDTYKGKLIIDKTGSEDVVVGVVTNAIYSKDYPSMRVDGILRYGGMDCSVLR